ncbi:MAG: dihydroorotate dehydrogenase electron transfer subunit [Myxococcota bacterium]
MATRFTARVQGTVELGGKSFLLRVEDAGELAGCAPGQFAMLRGEWDGDPILPRAMSVMRVRAGGGADFLMKEVGRGTRLFRDMRAGDRVTILGPLGHPFPAPDAARRDVLVAGGVGLAPLLMQAERAAAAGLADHVTLVHGGRTGEDLVLQDDLRATGVALRLATEDGSAGTRGRVTAALGGILDGATLMACGPTPMLRALHALALERGLPCHLALEETMACGIRACLGCAVPAREKPYLYVCTDGPVFEAREVWP